jgi:hypothetical protein
MYVLPLSWLMGLSVQRDFHPRQANLDKLLRYLLGGERPIQTAHQTLSRDVFVVEVRD